MARPSTRSERGPSPPLRVGILVNSLDQPAWVRRVLEDIKASAIAEIVLVVRNVDGPPPALQQALRYRHHLVPLLYDRLDARLARARRKPDAFARRSAEDLLAGCPVLEVRPRRTRYSDLFSDSDVEAILRYDLDVAVRFGFRILRGRALGMAKYGVWSYHHGDNLVNRGGPNSFWEVMQGDPVTGSVLQILTEDLDNGKVIYRSYSATNRHSLSLSRNAHYWKSAAFIQRRLRDLYEFGPSTLDQDPYAAQYTPYSGRLNRRPTNLESIRLLARFGARQLAHLAGRVAHQTQWQIAYGLSRESECLASSFFRFKRLQAPRGRSWSEPFPVAFGEKYFVFLTEQIHETGASHIVVLELDGQGFGSGSSVVLETAGGLSYPFIFEWAGHFYLIPNQPSQQQVALYRCTSFPGVWELDRVLLHDVNAANATLTELDRSWWMFVNMAVEGASLNDELHLYRAESPLGPWEPHRGNPIKSDVRSSRPGGRVFNWNGEYYRPAQDCSLREGYAISINRIVDLSPTSYREVETSKILPKWSPGLIANKTINHWGRLTCLDAAVRKTRLSAQ